MHDVNSRQIKPNAALSLLFLSRDDVAAGRSPPPASSLLRYFRSRESILPSSSSSSSLLTLRLFTVRTYLLWGFFIISHSFIFSRAVWVQCELSTLAAHFGKWWGFKKWNQSTNGLSASFSLRLLRCWEASEDHATPQAMASSAAPDRAVPNRTLR